MFVQIPGILIHTVYLFILQKISKIKYLVLSCQKLRKMMESLLISKFNFSFTKKKFESKNASSPFLLGLNFQISKLTNWQISKLNNFQIKNLALSFIALLMLANGVHAATITSAATGNWSATGTWVGGVVPTSSDDVVIANGHSVTVNGTYSCASLTIATGSTATSVLIGSNSLTVSGATTINGPSGGVNKFVQVTTGTFNSASVSVTSSGNAARDSYLHINGTGVMNITGNISLAGSGTMTYILFGGDGTLNVGGTINGTTGGFITSTTGGSTSAGPTTGTVNYNNSGAQNIGAYTYYNLTTSGSGTKTLAGNITASNIFTVGVNTTLDANTRTITLSGSGTPFVINGTFSPGTSTVSYSNATSASTNTNIALANYNNLTASPASACLRTLPNTGTIGISGTFTVGSATYTTTGSTIDFNGSVTQTIPALMYNNLTSSNSGARTLANSGTIGVAGVFTPGSNTYTNTGSTINYNGTGEQTVKAFNYNNLTISGSRGSNNVILESSGTIGIAGTYSVSATFSGGGFITTGSTVNWSSTVTANIPVLASISGSNYNNLTLSGASGTKTFPSDCSIGGTFTVSGANAIILNNSTTPRTFNVGNLTMSAGSLNVSALTGNYSFVINISGNYSKTAGTISNASSAGINTIRFNGGINQTFSEAGTMNYTVWEITNNSTVEMNSNWPMNGIIGQAFLVESGSTLNAKTFQITTNVTSPDIANLNLQGKLITANTNGLNGSTLTTLSSTNTPTLTLGANSEVVYNSGSTQTVTARTDYATLTIANTGSGSSTTEGNITCTSLNLTSGILTNANTLLVSGSSAGSVTGGSTTAFVNGPLRRTLASGLNSNNTTYSFPVGKGTTYYPFSIEGNGIANLQTGATSPVISVEAFAASTGGTYDATLLAISSTEYWNTSIVSGDFTGGSVSLGRQLSLGTLNAIGRSATLAGSYSSFFGTVSGNNVNSSSNVGNSLGFFLLARKTNCIAPTTPASNITFSSVNLYSLTASWTNGNGSKRIVQINTTNSFTDPSFGVDPSANSAYTSGEQVVYNGTGSSVNITGLSPNTTYYFRVYEANCSGTDVVFNTSTASNNPNSTTTLSCFSPVTQASSIVFANITPSTVDVSWTNGSGEARVVKINTTNSFSDPSGDPTVGSYGGTGEAVVYNGTGSGFTMSDLNPSTQYYFRVYERNCNGASSLYNTTSSTNNVTTSALTVYYNVSGANLNLPASWGTNTDGTGTNPTNFSSNGQEFWIVNGATATIAGTWAVSGSFSKVVLGSNTTAAIQFNIPSGFAFTGPIDVVAPSSGTNTLNLGHATIPTLGYIDPTSTIIYSYAGNQTVTATTYGNLTFSGSSGTKTFAGQCDVTNTLTISGVNTVLLNNTTSQRTFNFKNVTISAAGTLNGGSLAVSSGSFISVINISGDFNKTNGSLTTSNSFNQVVFNSGSVQSFANTGTLTKTQWIVSNNSTVNLTTAFPLSGATGTLLIINEGSSINAGTQQITAGGASITIDMSGTLITSNTNGLSGTTSTTLSSTNSPTLNLGTNSTVIYNSTLAQAFTARTDYQNIIIRENSIKTVGGTTTLGKDMTIENSATLAGGSNIITIGGNWLNSGTYTPNTSTVIFNKTSGTQTVNNSTSTFNNVTHSGGGTLQLLTNHLTAVGNLTNSGGILDVNNLNITVGGNWSNTAVFSAGSGTVTFNSTATGKTISGTLTGTSKFNNLTFNGSGGAWSFGANSADVDGNFTITNGTVTAPSTTLTVNGDFSNSGAFTHNSGTVSFNGNNALQTLGGSSSTAFNKVTVDKGTAKTNILDVTSVITMATATTSGTSLTITNGSFKLSSASTITPFGGSTTIPATGGFILNNSSATSNWGSAGSLTLNGDLTIINGTMSVGTGNNTLQITGTGVYTQSAGTMNVRGRLQGTTSGGSFTLTGGNFNIPSGGSVSTGGNSIFQATNLSTFSISGGTVTIASANGNTTLPDINITTGTISAGTFVVSDATVTVKSTIPFYNLTVQNGSGTAIAQLRDNITIANNLTLTSGTFDANTYTSSINNLVTVPSGATYLASTATQTLNGGLTISGGTFTGAAGTVTTTNVTLSSGTLTAPSGTFNVSGNWTKSGGTFTHNSGTVVFNGSNQSITGSNDFYSFNKTVSSGATLTLPTSATQTFAAGGTLTLQGAANNLLKIVSSMPGTQASINPNGTRVIDYVDAKDNNNTNATAINATNSYDAGNLTNWTFSAANLVWTGATSTAWNLASNWAAGYVPNATDNVTITKTGSNNLVLETSPTVNNITISASNNVSLGSNTLTVKGTWLNNGTLDAGSSTVVFAGTTGTQTVNNVGSSFNNVSHTGASTLQALVNALNIGGTFTNSAGTFDANSLGNTFTGAVTLSGGTYNAGSATQTFNGGLTVSGGTFSGSTGEVTTTNLTISSGTFTAPSTTLNISGDFSNSGTFDHSGGTVLFNGVTQSITGATTFYNLTHEGASAETLTLNSATVVNGNVTNNDGTLALNNINLTIGGNYSNSVGVGGFTPGTGSVIFNHASNTQTLSMADGGDFSNIQHTGAGTFQLLSDLAMTGNMTNSAGTLSVNGYNIVIGGNWTNSATFNPGAAANNSTYVALNGVSPSTQTIDNGSSQFNDLRVIGTATVTMVTPAQAFGDVVVNGPLASTAELILIGGESQTINSTYYTGTTPIPFQNLTVNKTAGSTITLNRPVKVTSTFTMTSGDVITTTSNILEVGTSATSVGSVSWTAGTVRGPMKRWFAAGTNSTQASGVFPVGATIPGKGVINRYAQVNFSSAPGAGGYIIAEYKTGTPSTGYTGLPLTYNTNQYIQNFEEEGYWDITPYNSSNVAYGALNTAPYTLKLRMNNPSTLQPGLPPSGSNGNSIVSISNLRIITSKGPSHNTWVLAGTQGAGQAVLASGDYLLEETGVTGFSFFNGGGNDNNPLPVELLSFTGACDEGIINLTWQTASEFNSSHFDVEKSRDGENWQLLTTLPSAGMSNELITYQSTDQNGTSGNNYFRLRQVDIDGTEKLYDPINVSCSEVTTGYFSSFPNPSGNAFQVIVNNKELVGVCTMNIVDASGKVIEQREIEVKDGINMFVVNQELTPGMYFLNISNGSKSTPVLRHAIK